LQITYAKLGKSEATNRGKRLVTVCAELARPNEFMNLTVAVPSNATDRDVCQRGIERAKDFARQFADMPLQQFPMPG
jgi:hypothetical protein